MRLRIPERTLPFRRRLCRNSLTSLPGGTNYNVVAQYSGDSTFQSSTSAPQAISVAPEASTTIVRIELYNPSTGQLVQPVPTSYSYGSLYAVVRMDVTSSAGDACSTNGPPVPGNYGCPTGSVRGTISLDGGAPIALDSGTYPLNSEGYTEDRTAPFAAGTNTIQASYQGDSSYSPSSGSAVVTVNKALASVQAPPPPYANFEDPYTLNVTVFGAETGAAPTGQVSVFVGATQMGEPVALSSGIAGSPTNGWASATATIVTSQLPLGTNSLTVQYTGDSNYAANSAGPLSMLTRFLTNAAVTTSSSTIQRGSSATFTATMTPEHPGGPAMTGTLTFLDNNFPLGSAITLVNGQAQFVVSSLSAGSHTIGVDYSGDSNYAPTTATLPGGETVNLLSTTTTLTTSNASVTLGQSVTLTATVSPAVPGGPAITGYVGFHTCPTSNTNNCLFALGTAPVSDGQAQLTTTIIPSGTIEVRADYDGDSNYTYSSATTAEIMASSLLITANPSALTIAAPGQSVSTTLTLTSTNGLTGSGALASSNCGIPATDEITCSLSPFTLPADGSATATLSFKSTAAGTTVPVLTNKDAPPGKIVAATLLLIAICSLIALAFAQRRTQRRWQLIFGAILFAVLITGVSCGGGGGAGAGGNGGGVPNTGTPVGAVQPLNVSITIGGVTQTVANLSLTVQ